MSNSTLSGTGESLPEDSGKSGKLGPSDTSDSGSDLAGLPEDEAGTDSGKTGERLSVDPDEEERTGADVLPDEVVDEERLARSPPGDDEDDATRARR